MKAIWRIIVDQHRNNRLHFWLGILVACLPALAGILLLGVAGWFITAAAIAGLTGIFLNIFAPSAMIRALALLRTGGRYGERLVTHDATFRFLTRLRDRIFAVMVFQGVRGRRSGGLLNRLTMDIDALDTVYLRLVVPLSVSIIVSVLLLLAWGGATGHNFGDRDCVSRVLVDTGPCVFLPIGQEIGPTRRCRQGGAASSIRRSCLRTA